MHRTRPIKRYSLYTHTVLAVSSTDFVLWLDVRVYYRDKPGRQRYELYPCLEGMAAHEEMIVFGLKDLARSRRSAKDKAELERDIAALELERVEALQSGFALSLAKRSPPIRDRSDAEAVHRSLRGHANAWLSP